VLFCADDRGFPTLVLPEDPIIAGDAVDLLQQIEYEDNVDEAVTVVCAMSSGEVITPDTTLPLGAIDITCSATDSSNNKASPQTFTVTIGERRFSARRQQPTPSHMCWQRVFASLPGYLLMPLHPRSAQDMLTITPH